jgi:hypothetical protein
MVMEWSANEVAIYRDGVLAGKVTQAASIPDFRHTLTLQLDARRNVMGDNTVRMFVDFAQVLKLKPGC